MPFHEIFPSIIDNNKLILNQIWNQNFGKSHNSGHAPTKTASIVIVFKACFLPIGCSVRNYWVGKYWNGVTGFGVGTFKAKMAFIAHSIFQGWNGYELKFGAILYKWMIATMAPKCFNLFHFFYVKFKNVQFMAIM